MNSRSSQHLIISGGAEFEENRTIGSIHFLLSNQHLTFLLFFFLADCIRDKARFLNGNCSVVSDRSTNLKNDELHVTG